MENYGKEDGSRITAREGFCSFSDYYNILPERLVVERLWENRTGRLKKPTFVTVIPCPGESEAQRSVDCL